MMAAESIHQPTRNAVLYNVVLVGGIVGATGPLAGCGSSRTSFGRSRYRISLFNDSLEASNSFLVAYNQHIYGGMLVAERGT